MSDDIEYNGWTNYATWKVFHEIFSDVDGEDVTDQMPKVVELRPFANDSTEDLVRSGNIDKLAASCYEIKEQVLDYIETSSIDDSSELVKSLARAFLEDVDWAMIARRLADLKEDREEEEIE